MKRFEVNLYPAHRWKDNPQQFGFSFLLASDIYPKKTFKAANTAAVLAEVQDFAKGHGQACHASVRCLDKPKPAGFDKATARLYFNMENAPLT